MTKYMCSPGCRGQAVECWREYGELSAVDCKGQDHWVFWCDDEEYYHDMQDIGWTESGYPFFLSVEMRWWESARHTLTVVLPLELRIRWHIILNKLTPRRWKDE